MSKKRNTITGGFNASKSQKGFVLIFAIIIAIILYIIAVSLCDFVIIESKTATLVDREVKALYLADAGLEYFKSKLVNDGNLDPVNGHELINSVNVVGTFSVKLDTSISPNPTAISPSIKLQEKGSKWEEYNYKCYIKSEGILKVAPGGEILAKKTVLAEILYNDEFDCAIWRRYEAYR